MKCKVNTTDGVAAPIMERPWRKQIKVFISHMVKKPSVIRDTGSKVDLNTQFKKELAT